MKRCKCCNYELNELVAYCPNCGILIEKEKRMDKNVKFVLLVGGGVVVLVVLIFLFVFNIFSNVSKNSQKLVCKSKYADITIMYKDDEILGFVAHNISYDLTEQKKVARRLGVEHYLKDFETWFIEFAKGSCEYTNK